MIFVFYFVSFQIKNFNKKFLSNCLYSMSRYYPNQKELQILIHALNRYFRFPDKDPNRNMTAKSTSIILQKISDHWTHRNVRIWFNNNQKQYFIPEKENQNDKPENQKDNYENQNSEENDEDHQRKILQISDSTYFYSENHISNDYNQEHINTIKSLRLQLSNLELKFEKVVIKYQGLENKYNQELEKYKKFYEKYKNYENIEPLDQSPKEVLRSELIKKYLKNKSKKYQGWRYTRNIYDFCKILQNLSSKCYELMREVYILPTIDSLDKHFGDEEKHIRKLLKDVSSIPKLIDIYKKLYNVPDNLECIVSIDAASLDRPNKKGHSFVFILYLQPIDPKFKCFPIHIHSKCNGRCDPDIINLIEEVNGLLQSSGIFVKAIASDGDSGYNDKANETFKKYINIFKKDGFYAAVEYIMQSKETFFISDLLHIVKLARKRIIKGPITISASLKSKFTRESLESILQLGLVLTDESSLSFMKDYYPLKLFSFSNTLKLYENGKYDEFLYFLPFTLWIESVMSPSLTKRSRLYFLRVSFYMFYSFLLQYERGEFDSGVTIYNTKDSEAQSFNSYNFMIRCLNTIIVTYSIMVNTNEVALDRISSHPVENFFGHVRIMCYSFDSYDNFIRVAVDTIMNMILCNKLQS